QYRRQIDRSRCCYRQEITRCKRRRTCCSSWSRWERKKPSASCIPRAIHEEPGQPGSRGPQEAQVAAMTDTRPEDLASRIAALSPAKRALLELMLSRKQSGSETPSPELAPIKRTHQRGS